MERYVWQRVRERERGVPGLPVEIPVPIGKERQTAGAEAALAVKGVENQWMLRFAMRLF
jgi:hypothetical protein